MKKVYWRPRSVSRTGLILIAAVALAGLLIVEQFKSLQERPYYDTKLAAAELAQQAMDAIKEARIETGPPIDAEVDPAETGLVGLLTSPVTSVSGVLPAKQTSANPNFAAVIVDMLKEAGVKDGDVVALGVSGSFPALNACAYAACEAMEIKPIVIASAAASGWGGNVPDLLWIDMERICFEKGVFTTRSIAASPGGYEDQGLGLTDEGQEIVRGAITDRNGLKLIDIEDFDKNVAKRIDMYRKAAKGRPIKCYINIGGGATSVGRTIGKKMFRPGLNLRSPTRIDQVNGVMPTLITEGVPCIHLVHIMDIAERYGLPLPIESLPAIKSEEAEQMTQLTPFNIEVGQAGVFEGIDYNRPLTVIVLVLVLGSLYAFIRTDIGFRLLRGGARKRSDSYPEPMV